MSMSSVLVAVGGEQCDDEVVRLGCELLNSGKGKLHILYVIEVDRGFPLDAEIPPATVKGGEVLQHVEEVVQPYRCSVEADIVQTRRAGSAVVQEAVDRRVDTILLGAPYLEKFGSFTLGDTIPYVLEHAPCRVIVWRDPTQPNIEVSSNGRVA